MIVAVALAIGVLGGAVVRAIPADLGASIAPSWAPVSVAALVLAVAWLASVSIATQRRASRSSTLLATGLMPVAAMVVAGPVAGLYFALWPTLVLTPIALVVAARRTKV